MDRHIPEFRGALRDHMIEVPAAIQRVSGIRVFGRLIRSIVFSTDVAVIRNINADAVIAVYPFTPQPAITQALLSAAEMPVFAGVGGGITTGHRVANLAMHAEFQGAFGVVVNAPTADATLTMLKNTVDIPIIVTVVSENTDIGARLSAGANILNVSAAAKTPAVVACIRARFPSVPIIATGGPTEQSIQATIDAGANAITYTPPTNGELFRVLMEKYRAEHGAT